MSKKIKHKEKADAHSDEKSIWVEYYEDVTNFVTLAAHIIWAKTHDFYLKVKDFFVKEEKDLLQKHKEIKDHKAKIQTKKLAKEKLPTKKPEKHEESVAKS